MDRTARLERVRRRMAADGVDTLVALSSARHSMARPDLATHLSGFRSLGRERVRAATATAALASSSRHLMTRNALSRAAPIPPSSPPTISPPRWPSFSPSAARSGAGSRPAGSPACPIALAARVIGAIGADARRFRRGLGRSRRRPRPATRSPARARPLRSPSRASRGFSRSGAPGMRECDLAVEMQSLHEVARRRRQFPDDERAAARLWRGGVEQPAARARRCAGGRVHAQLRGPVRADLPHRVGRRAVQCAGGEIRAGRALDGGGDRGGAARHPGLGGGRRDRRGADRGGLSANIAGRRT